MGHRLIESSSDIVVEAEATDLGAALVEAAKAFSEITTANSPVERRRKVTLEVEKPGDLARLAAGFLNHLVFLFSTENFLPSSGEIRVEATAQGHRARGHLEGEDFDRARHRLGTEVKAATLHDARFEVVRTGARLRLLLDL